MRDLLTPFWQSFAVSLLLDMPEGSHPCNGLKGCPLEYFPGPEKHVTD